LRIGELSRRTGVPTRMLRYYEEQDLLHPERDANGYRCCSPSASSTSAPPLAAPLVSPQSLADPLPTRSRSGPFGLLTRLKAAAGKPEQLELL
jgi:MerR family regulatory protein